MAYYRGTAEGQDKAMAVAAVVLVHAGLAAIILAGLNVPIVHEAVERMTTIQIREPEPPPPEPPPPPAQQAQRAREEEGAAGKKANPTPVVAPKPRIVVPTRSPVVAAPVPGTGSASSAGAANFGTGTGAGGSGSGRGGGGTGDFSGFSPARMLNKIPDREYRRISGGRIPRGSATIAFRVDADGRMSNCRVVRSSGDKSVDSIVCDAATRHLRFSPARDPNGRAVAQDMSYTPSWRPNY